MQATHSGGRPSIFHTVSHSRSNPVIVPADSQVSEGRHRVRRHGQSSRVFVTTVIIAVGLIVALTMLVIGFAIWEYGHDSGESTLIKSSE
jgi:hypothetical protein